MKRTLKAMALFMAMVCIAATTTATAAVPIEPFASNSHDLRLSFSGNTAICELVIFGAAGTTRIDNITISLREDKNLTPLRQWTNLSVNGSTFRWSGTASPVVAGRTYTLSFTATVHRNGVATPVSGSIARVR